MLKKYAVVVVVRHRAFLFQAFIATGFNLILTFDPTPAFNPAHRQCDYEKEPGKVRKVQYKTPQISYYTIEARLSNNLATTTTCTLELNI